MKKQTNVAKLIETDLKRQLVKARKKLRIQKKTLSKLKTPNKKIATKLDSWVQQNFRSEGGRVGKWKPFAYGGRLQDDGSIDQSAKLLQDTGRLRISFVAFATNIIAGIGSDLPYSITHEKGTKRIPKRRMLPEEKDFKPIVGAIYTKHVRKTLD